MDISKSTVLTTMVGFIYLLGIFFWIILLFGIPNLCFLSIALPYSAYIVLIILPVSYICGVTAYMLINELLVPAILRKLKCVHNHTERQNYEFYLLQYASEPFLNSIQIKVGLFYAFRSLFVGLLFLMLSSFLWLNRTDNMLAYIALVTLSLLLIMVLFAYIRWRKPIDTIIDDAVKFLKTQEKNKVAP
jgi:hypothetical protein